MNKKMTFFGLDFTILTFVLLALAWTICLFAVFPYFLNSDGWIYIFYTVGALFLAGFVNRKILFLLVAVFFINKTVVAWFQNFMLVLSGFLATFIYRLFVYKSFWMTVVHFLIITFSVFVYYTLLIKVLRMAEED
jgi:Zn-dependent protease with chaperone function